MRGRFGWAALLACVLVVGSSTSALSKKAPPAPPLPSWPQAHSDIPADPTIIFGVLPNGMRYLIKKNTMPAHQVALRLRIAAGSLDETDDEEGIAHFLEHMAFRGSKNVADGDVSKTLQSLGASPGSDTNAFTLPDNTVFMFDIPVNDDAALDKGLMLTREIAGNLSLDQKALDSERSVVLAEERQGDVAGRHAYKAYMAEIFGARIADAMLPIGKVATVKEVQAPLIRNFYSAYYRPELAVLAIVGDIDPQAVEAKIKAHFSDWKAAAPAVKPPAYTVAFGTGLHTTVFTEPATSTTATMSWVMPDDNASDSVAKTQRSIIRSIAFAVLNQRLEKLVLSAKPPFDHAGASYVQYNTLADVAALTVAYRPGQALEALRAAHDTYADILHSGVAQEEVDRAVSNWRTSYQSFVVASHTLRSPGLASAYLGAVDRNDVIDSPEDGLALFESSVKNFTAEQITAVLHTLLAGDPFVFISSPTPIEGAEKDVAAIFAQTQQSAPVAQASPVPVWPYTSFGPDGKVASQKTIDDLGVTFVTFANGVRATIKPTKFLAGQVFISIRFGDGRMVWTKNRPSPSWALGNSFMVGGLGRISPTDVRRALAGKELNVSFNVTDTAYEIRGATRPADYQTELQFATAFLTDPAWRPEAFEKIQSDLKTALPQIHATADGVFGLDFWWIAHNRDHRWDPPAAEDVGATHLDDVKALLQDALKDGHIEVIVVGDISVEDAVKGLQTTLAALPKRHVQTTPSVGDERLQSAQKDPIVLHYQGPGDQSVASIAWHTTSTFPDLPAVRTQLVLEKILAQRLFDELRTNQGMTYTPQTQTANSIATSGWGILRVFANVPTPRIADFYAAVEKTVSDLKSKEVSAEELERARGPLVHDLQNAQQNNLYWLVYLQEAQIDPRRLDGIRTNLSDLQKVTAADVQRAAQTYLLDDRAWKLVAMPQKYAKPPDGK